MDSSSNTWWGIAAYAHGPNISDLSYRVVCSSDSGAHDAIYIKGPDSHGDFAEFGALMKLIEDSSNISQGLDNVISLSFRVGIAFALSGVVVADEDGEIYLDFDNIQHELLEKLGVDSIRIGQERIKISDSVLLPFSIASTSGPMLAETDKDTESLTNYMADRVSQVPLPGKGSLDDPDPRN